MQNGPSHRRMQGGLEVWKSRLGLKLSKSWLGLEV